MNRFYRASCLAVAAAVLLAPAAVAAPPAVADTVWRNPSNSVHVRVHSCGAGRCGTVIWASEKAKADSARGGTPNLVGSELFRDFRQTGPKLWKGKVFVPDLNRMFGGTGTVVNSNTIIARGCLVGKMGCKSQTWSRVSSAAN